ncbi:ATP-binding protein [Gilliamella sp. BG1]|uniref:ATP-binding protein n=1 Tax=Gilliamella sp. BG1 TaxID=3351508 RepID=UPI0039862557
MTGFQIAARTLLHLGAELITSDAIAINELIKNAIDAKSPNVNVYFIIPINQKAIDKIHIILQEMPESDKVNKEDITSIIEILKNNINTECSKEILQALDKIIQKIGKLESRSEIKQLIDSINYILIEDSGDGMSEKLLKDVFLTIGTPNKLNSDNSILGNKGIGRLAMMRLGKKATVISWQSTNAIHKIIFDWEKFEDVRKTLSEIPIDLAKIEKPSKNISQTGTRIKITKLTREWTKDNIKNEIIDGFLRRLQNPFDTTDRFPINILFNTKNISNRLPVKKMSPKLWQLAQKTVICEFQPDINSLSLEIKNNNNQDSITPYKTNLNTLAHQFDTTPEELAKIGSFNFKLKWFNRKILKSEVKEQGLSSESREIIDELNLWSGGVAIYRDGFRIGYSGSQSDKDWFEIDRSALRGQGFTVNRIQIVASLEISKSKNLYLQDRSNREGLVENTQVNLIKRIISEIVLLEFKNIINSDKDREAQEYIQNVIESGSSNTIEKLEKIRTTINTLKQETTDKNKKAVFSSMHDELHQVANKIKEFDQIANSILEQRENIIELAGAGTMMHSVLHELVRSTTQTRELLKKLAKKEEKGTADLLVKLEDEIKIINNRLRQFDPLSQLGRNKKANFNTIEKIKTIIQGNENKLITNDIKTYITVDGGKCDEFYIEMVPGFFAIVMENLISNSIYWLSQTQIFPRLASATENAIYIDIDRSSYSVSITDTGPGISPGDKERIFTPGFTTKKSWKEGKGFGLFIARELTKYYKGHLYLDSTPDEDGRLRNFIFELPKNK